MNLLENIEIKSWDQLINVGTIANYFVNYASVNPEDIKLLPKNMQEELAVVVMLFIRNALAVTGKEFEVTMSKNDNALIKNLKESDYYKLPVLHYLRGYNNHECYHISMSQSKSALRPMYKILKELKDTDYIKNYPVRNFYPNLISCELESNWLVFIKEINKIFKEDEDLFAKHKEIQDEVWNKNISYIKKSSFLLGYPYGDGRIENQKRWLEVAILSEDVEYANFLKESLVPHWDASTKLLFLPLIKNLKKTNHVIFKAFEGVYNDINNLNENDIFIEPKTNFSIGVSFPNLLILLKGVKVYKEEDLIVTFKHWIDCLAQKKDIANLNIFEYIYSITIKDEKLRFSIELPNDEIPKEIVEQNIKNTINTIIKSLKEKKRVKEVFDSEYGESLTQKLLMESDLKELNLSTVKSKKLKF